MARQFKVTLERTMIQHADVLVEAEDAEQAEAIVDARLDEHEGYADDVVWSDGEQEGVLDIMDVEEVS